MFHYRTEGFNGYSVKYSPFYDNRLATAASANFGLVGNGRLYILSLTPTGIICERYYDTQDSLFDVAFSESHENQVAVASGDGSIKLFDTALEGGFPIANWGEHKREVFCLSWNLVDKSGFVSSSWDGDVKLWSPTSPHSLLTIPIHSCTYSALFSPHSPTLISTASSDSTVRLFDIRIPPSSPTLSIPVSPNAPSELLTQDWNKYRPDVLAVAGVDKAIRTFDVRFPNNGPLAELLGHEYAVRRIAWSPHWGDVLISASYDMTVRVWSDGSSNNTAPGVGGVGGLPGGGRGRMMGVMDRHTEFCAGVDWCLFGGEGWAASVGWDEAVWVWDVGSVMGSR
ncbi:WD40-repeat-containing domain protein [Tuber indicum]|nr:WD40-repeat-containing domain protein [Tuber indicum]